MLLLIVETSFRRKGRRANLRWWLKSRIDIARHLEMFRTEVIKLVCNSLGISFQLCCMVSMICEVPIKAWLTFRCVSCNLASTDFALIGRLFQRADWMRGVPSNWAFSGGQKRALSFSVSSLENSLLRRASNRVATFESIEGPHNSADAKMEFISSSSSAGESVSSDKMAKFPS